MTARWDKIAKAMNVYPSMAEAGEKTLTTH
jgi:hypothetical protein